MQSREEWLRFLLPGAIHPGDLVQINSGPFNGYEAIFDARLPGTERVRVLLQFLSDRHVPVELNVAHIQQKKRP